VKLIIDEAFTHLSVVEIYAGTAKDNVGSRKVLERNGFVLVGEEKDVLLVNGTLVDGVMYSRLIDTSQN
jgi:RimJ/RimL family protein N-acetyltransferase